MRTFLLLFCTSVFSLSNSSVFSQSAKITVNKDMTVTVDEVFRMLKAQTDYTFIYQVDLFKDTPKVTLKKGVISANQLLSQSLSSDEFETLYDDSTHTLVVRNKPKDVLAVQDQDTYLVQGVLQMQIRFLYRVLQLSIKSTQCAVLRQILMAIIKFRLIKTKPLPYNSQVLGLSPKRL